MKSKLSNDDKFIIVHEKIDNHKTIDVFRGQPEVNPNTGEKRRFEGAREDLFKEHEFKKMAEKYSFNEQKPDLSIKKWNNKDFKSFNFEFIPQREFPMMEYIKNGTDPEMKIFYFSEVIQYSDKYYLFTYMEGTTRSLYLSTPTVIVMEKKNGNWTVVQQISDYVFH